MKLQVLLLEAAGPESAAVVAAATAVGIGVHAATHSSMHAAYPPGLRDALTMVVFTDFTDPDRAIADLTGHAVEHGIGGVLTLHEFLTPLAARLADALGLPGNDPGLAPCARNKIAMAGRFTDCGVPIPASWTADGPDEFAALLASGDLPYPLVIKPAENAGSTGVTIATDPRQALAAAERAEACDRQPHYGIALDPRLLLQEHVTGAEYSVESVTQRGRTTHLAITAKTTTPGTRRVEIGHNLPAALPADARETILTAADAAITAVGIRDTASHTEIMLTPDGTCMIIEIAARLGSGQIGFLLQHALGLDPWTALLDLALGRPIQTTPTRARYAAIRFLTSPRPGRLTAIRGLPETGPQVPSVRLRRKVGDLAGGLDGNADRIGHLLVTGTDPHHVAAHADALLARIEIDVT
ncbi:ATP-grasp domain-containing protein [Actinomadura viridis]|uniref:ATP-grasp domain-containing protein n=1 Tax=Actinomadura viridis TaxID=58110 RepID=UPI0036CD32C4